MLNSFKLFLFVLLIAIGTQSCEKKEIAREEVPAEAPEKDTVKTVPPATRDELTKDSIFLYAKEVYLWNDVLPSIETFKPRSYNRLASKEANYDAELFAITQFKIDALTSKPYEYTSTAGEPKYSYISDANNQNPVAVITKKSSVNLEGNGYDFGIQPGLYGSPTNYQVLLQAVYPGSDAAAKGIQRGDMITSINGRTIGSNYNAEVDFLNSTLFDVPSVSLIVKKSTGATVSAVLNRTSYRSNPIYKDSVYTSGNKVIGYLAYARFSSMANSKSEFDRVFSKFASKGVTDLIIDLRYNGGGYVSTAEYLSNLIAPFSLNGSVMYTEHFNSLMRSGEASILKKQPLKNAQGALQYSNGKLVTYADIDYSVAANTNYFSKKGSLNNIRNAVFIVSKKTASASELVINSLKPHLNVKVVGEVSYGKPVGFFPIRIAHYDVYYSMFESKNSLGQGGYYAGITPDTGSSASDNDDPAFDFGDLRERSFAAAYSYLTNSTFTASLKNSASVLSKGTGSILSGSEAAFGNQEFKGMIEDRFKIKQ